ncbi:MAG TPA: hypothetical protein VIU85_07360 [Chthoniobacterales bacterium]
MHLRFYLHAGLWCALFAVFIALSVSTVGPAILENKIGPIDPNHSTDSYLGGLIHVRSGSELFVQGIETLPRDKSIKILVDAGNSPSEFLGMLVAYLSWPRDVQIVRVSPSTYAQELAATNKASVSAVVLCHLKAPVWIKDAAHFGPSITLVPTESLNANP